jgi:hypothetical protein
MSRVKLQQPLGEKPRFNFGGKTPETATSIKTISLDFSLPSYLVDYVYDAENQNYQRMIGGIIHTDAKKNKVNPKNIVIQFTNYWVNDEGEGRLDLTTGGFGIAWYFSGGKFWEGSWIKEGNLTEFLNANDEAVSLSPGQTFIEIIDDSSKVIKF